MCYPQRNCSHFDSIIFVPDLRRGVVSAWTYEGVCWPRDILGLELPDARIILYGLDFFSLKNENSIFCCARDMLFELNGNCGGDMQVISYHTL
jgi:hypothetical protein